MSKLANVLLVASAALCACETNAPPRRQTIVVVDTDLFTVEDVAADPEVSALAAIDTVRVDVLDDANKVTVFREFSASSRLDWPVSFALLPPEDGALPPTRLRIRGFRARDAESLVEGDVPTLSPFPELAVDRVVEIAPPPKETVSRVLLVLEAACLSRPASFGDRTTCVDGGAARPFDTALPPVDERYASRVGTTTLGRSEPCGGEPPPDVPRRICVPGGLGVLGSRRLAGFEDQRETSTLPQRLVHVAPFFVDEVEFTVGRARPLLAKLESPPPALTNGPEFPDAKYCTSTPTRESDPFPLNCVYPETAAELCALSGGRLPSEAEWSHMATGRGLGWSFPWGERAPDCCVASIGRKVVTSLVIDNFCDGEGVERAGSHRGAFCPEGSDRSRDGVLDLGGSLVEALGDAALPFDHPCWGPRFGILVDPRCDASPTDRFHGARGGYWSASPVAALSGLRNTYGRGISSGFRCVYPVKR